MSLVTWCNYCRASFVGEGEPLSYWAYIMGRRIGMDEHYVESHPGSDEAQAALLAVRAE